MKKALIVLNMGSPKNLDEVEIFLKNMFNDPNILSIKNRFLRKLIAFIIVTTRKSSAKEHYQKIGGKSPILEYTLTLIEKLKQKLNSFDIYYSFRYTPPYSFDVIKELKKIDYKDIWLLPLYPHYSITTTKSSIDDFLENLKKENYHPNCHIIERFYEEENYNKAILERIKETLKEKDSKEFSLIFSAHSLPQKVIEKGDCYKAEVEAHVNILKNLILLEKMEFKEILLAYQSKLGPIKWLEPSLETTLQKLKNKKVLIFPISFVFDNVETDFELSIEYKEIAKNLGYEEYIVSKCPNDSDLLLNSIIKLICK